MQYFLLIILVSILFCWMIYMCSSNNETFIRDTLQTCPQFCPCCRRRYRRRFNDYERMNNMEKMNDYERMNDLEKMNNYERMNDLEKMNDYEHMNGLEKMEHERMNTLESMEQNYCPYCRRRHMM